MWVVKLGGSLLGTPELKSWLEELAHWSDGRVVIVPGGGIFADAVREAQRIAAFDDATAHRMALLAMEQYGLALQGLQPELVTAASELEIAECSWQHRPIVWLPSKMALADESVPQCWEVTSDSLAAWLAWKIGASRLILVKHLDIPETTTLEQMAQMDILDPAFAAFASRLTCRIQVVSRSRHAWFAAELSGKLRPARAV